MTALALSPVGYSSPPRCRYQVQDSTQTLAEGLVEYYLTNHGNIARPSDLPPDSAALFRSHDICHVIFGLDTTFADEAMADIRTLLGCDVGARRYVTYFAKDAQALAILKEVGVFAFVWGTIIAVPRIVRACMAARSIPKRWPWLPPEEFQQRTLADLRREFGIRVIWRLQFSEQAFDCPRNSLRAARAVVRLPV